MINEINLKSQTYTLRSRCEFINTPESIRYNRFIESIYLRNEKEKSKEEKELLSLSQAEVDVEA